VKLLVKDTGVIRKIDELGRIVIPKEIRRTLGIRDGENLEIFVDKQSISLQKHSSIVPIEDLASKLFIYAKDSMGIDLFLFDLDKIVVSTCESLMQKGYNDILNRLIRDREVYESSVLESLFPEIFAYYYVIPLIVNGDVIGLLGMYANDKISSFHKQFIQFLKCVLINKIDFL